MGRDFSIPIKGKNSILEGFTPAGWFFENVRGCNLQCWHCPTTKFPKGEYSFMGLDTFTNAVNIIKEISPKTRIVFANAGEPTLHPELYEMLRIGRKILPEAQFDVITNGIRLLKGEVTYKEMFDAGVNIVIVDIYGPAEPYVKLAKASGYDWYDRFNPPSDCKLPKAWTNNHKPKSQCIIFQPNPSDWPKTKNKKIMLSTYLNEIDFNLALPHGVTPCLSAPNRKCDQPSKYANICWDGKYVFCCVDFMRLSIKHKLGDVSTGVQGFMNFWLGKYMQSTRQMLSRKNRNAHDLCSKCNMCGSRSDVAFWDENALNQYYKNGEWFDLETGVDTPKKGLFY